MRVRHKAFTLIELLVVIAIISLLVSILLPSLSKAKELARRVVCLGNLRQIGLGYNLYMNDFDESTWITPAGGANPSLLHQSGWVGTGHLLEAGYLTNADIFRCPSRVGPGQYPYSQYVPGSSAAPPGYWGSDFSQHIGCNGFASTYTPAANVPPAGPMRLGETIASDEGSYPAERVEVPAEHMPIEADNFRCDDPSVNRPYHGLAEGEADIGKFNVLYLDSRAQPLNLPVATDAATAGRWWRDYVNTSY
jgi:prepilin-type N-terminal cleavage/methylation domain-containing protein